MKLLKLAAVLSVVGLICLWVLFVTGCGKKSIPATAARPVLLAWVEATGKSMWPAFPAAALVQIEVGVPFADLKAGDTVIFWDYTQAKPRFIHHRLKARQLGNWISQGDNAGTNQTADQAWVTPDNYIARTTGKYVQLLFAPAP